MIQGRMVFLGTGEKPRLLLVLLSNTDLDKEFTPGRIDRSYALLKHIFPHS